MKLIYSYVQKNFLRYLLSSLLVLVFIYIIINLFDNLGKYLARSVVFKDIVIYYLYLVPSYVTLLIPVAAIIGVFFIFGLMTKNREMIALKASGFDVNNLMLMILVTGIGISAATFAFQETVGVWAQGRLFEHKSEKIDKRPVRIQEHRRIFFYYGENNWVYFIRDFDGKTNRINSAVLWNLDKEQRIVKRIDASAGEYHDGTWVFSNAVIRDFDTTGAETIARVAVLTMPELIEKPADFLKRVRPIEEMNFIEIARFVQRKSKAGENVAKEEVELNYRFSFPLITIILLVICLPLSLVLRKGGIAIGLGISIILAFVYWGLIQSCRAYGVAGLMTPLLAAWLPNIIFGAFAVVSTTAIRR